MIRRFSERMLTPALERVEDFDIPFTNNVSERSLRSIKSEIKIAEQIQNNTSAKNHATIRTYTKTCKRHGLTITRKQISLLIVIVIFT